MTTEPTEPNTSKPVAGTESQQQLAKDLEEIAAKQLQQPDDEAVILYDAEHPENETPTIEVDKTKLNFERDITELSQRVVGAMVDFSERIALINGEARGEEQLAIDVQFTKTIQLIRERVIDRVPELADQCWKISNKAREDELASMKKLDRVVDDTRMVMADSGRRVAEQLKGLQEAVKDNADGRQIDGLVRSADQNLVNGLKYVEGELKTKVPGCYGEVETELEELVGSYKRLLNAADRPLSDSEQDEFGRFLRERSDAFLAHLAEKAKLERDRVGGITDSMHQFYSQDYQPALSGALEGLK